MANANLSISQKKQLSAQLFDQNGNLMSGPFTWVSSAPSVATVDQNGLVTAVANGSANITASNGSVTSAVYSVAVAAPVATTIQITSYNTVGPENATPTTI
jgi:uncharacterized protein YjdB